MIIKHLLILILSLTCCSENNHNQHASTPKSQSAYNRQSSPPQKLSSIDKENLKKEIIEELRQEFNSEPKKKDASYYHVSVSGSIIVSQNGTNKFKWKKKCNYCGNTESSTRNDSRRSGGLSTMHYCHKCKKKSKVKIETSKN